MLPPTSTSSEPLAICAAHIILSPLRAAGYVSMKTESEPSAMKFGFGWPWSRHTAASATARIAARPLMRTVAAPRMPSVPVMSRSPMFSVISWIFFSL